MSKLWVAESPHAPVSKLCTCTEDHYFYKYLDQFLHRPQLSLKMDPAFSYLVMLFFKLWLTLLDVFFDALVGYSVFRGWRSERARSLWYEHSAQKVKVVGRGSVGGRRDVNYLENFLYVHRQYVHPKIVLEVSAERDNAIINYYSFRYLWLNNERP